jgi:hypothetical protein
MLILFILLVAKWGGVPNIAIDIVMENDICAIIPKGHKLWNKKSVDFKDLANEKICTVNNMSQTHITWRKAIGELSELGLTFENSKEILLCETLYEMFLYICLDGYIGLSSLFGIIEMIVFSDRMKSVEINCQHIPYGDYVFAYKEDNDRARAVVELMKS